MASLAQRPHGERVLGYVDIMLGAVEGAGHTAVLVMVEMLGQMLKQRSAERDVDQLHAAANAQHG